VFQVSVVRVRVPAPRGSPEVCTDVPVGGKTQPTNQPTYRCSRPSRVQGCLLIVILQGAGGMRAVIFTIANSMLEGAGVCGGGWRVEEEEDGWMEGGGGWMDGGWGGKAKASPFERPGSRLTSF